MSEQQVAGLQVRRVPLTAIHEDPANARAHPEANLDAIVASLRRFGQAEPLVVQAGTGRVIGGNGRLVAMRRLGWQECDVVELAIDDLQATALGIALNRTGELAAWDLPALTTLLEQLRAEDSLDGVGYTGPDIDALLAEVQASIGRTEIVEDEVPEPPDEATTQRGDLWILGRHRLLCGDSTNPEHVRQLVGGETAELLSSDPPYCVNYTGKDRPIHDGKPSGKDWSRLYREVDIEDLGEFLDGVFQAVLPHVRDGAAIYVWHAHVQQPTIAAVFERHGLLLHQVLVWVKPTAVFGHSYYRWRHEPCAFGWRQGHKPKHGVAQLDTVWEVDWEGKQRIVGNEHPTQKPTRLFEIPIELHTRPGAVVLEPFSGSGSQIIAAEKLGRRCRAMEIEPAFVDVAIERWQRFTGEKAILDGDGRTFAEIAAERGGSS